MSLTPSQIQILKDNASLILAPSAPYGVGGFQSIRPYSEAGRFDFSRTTTKTVNKTGGITTVPINTPAVNDAGALVFEPARTNVLTYSQEFDNPAWLKNGVTVVANQATSPDGTLTADLVYPSTGTDQRVNRAITILNATTYSTSFYAKKAGKHWIRTYGVGFSNPVSFDLENGVVVVAGSGATGTITEESDGWYRCTVTQTSTSTSGQVYINVTDQASSGSVTGSGTDGVYLWGAQLEVGSYATSYIPTAGSTVTRTADSFINSKVSSLVNNSEGTLFYSVSIFESNFSSISLNDNTSNNRVGFNFIPGSGFNTIITVGGVNQVNLSAGSPLPNTFYNIAIRYKANDFAMFVNGVKIISQLSGITFPSGTLTTIKSNSGSGASPFYGRLEVAAIIPTALDDATAIELTT